MKSLLLFAFVLVFTAGPFTMIGQAQDHKRQKTEEIVTNHIKSIGSLEVLAKISNQVALGDISFRILRSGGAGADGKIVLASEDKKILMGMSFSVANYPREVIVFDGENSKISFAYNNVRSPLGNYLYRYSNVLKEGLLGGVLSAGWALKKLDEKKARVEFKGTRKIDGKEVYALSYMPRGGSDLEIYIFIDKENFWHVRTEYRRIISAGQSTSPDASSSIRERREVLVEDFSDYKQVNGLTLPYRYKIYLMLEGQTLNEYEWTANFASFLFNQQLDPDSFNTKEK